jgi:hypothetical protein
VSSFDYEKPCLKVKIWAQEKPPLVLGGVE